MGRQARGVTGIRLRDMDEVVGMDKLAADSEILTVTEQGYGKRTKAGEYRVTQRGGKGIINMKVTEKTGAVVGLKVARPDQELMLITTDGIVIRTTVEEISLISRNTQGVTLMKTEEGDRVASLAVMDTKNE
jgi:DNA gyrase subunit A